MLSRPLDLGPKTAHVGAAGERGLHVGSKCQVARMTLCRMFMLAGTLAFAGEIERKGQTLMQSLD